MSRNIVMVWHHDLGLVVLSILVSILAAIAARELLGRINEARGQIWLAYPRPVPLLFDWRMVLFSLLVGISGGAATLFVLP